MIRSTLNRIAMLAAVMVVVSVVPARAQERRVSLDDLEDNPQKYLNQTVIVDAEVQEVLGPHLFKIDEVNWADLTREVLVFMPPELVALVRENDRVSVTGTLRSFARADITREMEWLDFDRDIEISLSHRPVLIANRVVSSNTNAAIVLDMRTAAMTDAEAPADAVTDPAALARGTSDLVGRDVDLGRGTIASTTSAPNGFFMHSGAQQVFVLTAPKATSTVKSGEMVSVEGVVLSMPRDLARKLTMPDSANDTIYVYATQVKKSDGR